MASPASFTRSAARATSSAYRRLPIRWRLAGGSAVLTLVILLGFAVLVGVLTSRRLHADFDRSVASAADELQDSLQLRADLRGGGDLECQTAVCPIRNLSDYAAPRRAVVRIVNTQGRAYKTSSGAPYLGPPREQTVDVGDFQVEARPLPVVGRLYGSVWVQYAERKSTVDATAARIRFFLALGVFGGAALALLAGLATARRAMSPVTELTEAARTIQRTRDPSQRLPAPEADDEVAELARTLEGMLRSLDDAQEETEAALARQREFVADASHELRTPLTSVLANLELLEEELEGDSRDAASSALRSTRRMRRLVADLLLLARADASRSAPHEPVDLAAVAADVAAELAPVAGEHTLSVEADEPVVVLGIRDELHRLTLNLMDNAIKHTAPGTSVRAIVAVHDGDAELAVEDQGPGVPVELADRVFERFVRGSSDRGGSSGLGLSIVRAVAETHGGTVHLETPGSGTGARFVVRLPAADRAAPAESDAVSV